MTSELSRRILRAVDDQGVLLVHDRVLPSVTGLVVGEPIAGSWWSHPMANAIYTALGELDDAVATVKLVTKKDTLVARSLWPDLVAIGQARSEAQLRGLGPASLDLLDDIEAAVGPLIVDRSQADLAKDLALRLLVIADEVHTDAGHHAKAYSSWSRWATTRAVAGTDGDAERARRRFEDCVASWPATKRSKLLPW